jgi:peptidoglycan/LPS O-acetylase OafA/YrhL
LLTAAVKGGRVLHEPSEGRIAPALFVVFAASVFLGYKYLLPVEFAQLANSLLAALLSVSNFVFWQQSGYFDMLCSSKPLL